MELYHDTVQDSKGNIINGATVTVTVHSSGAVATIYDKDGNALSNPFLSGYDRNAGEIDFAAADGLYDIQIVSGSTTTLKSIGLFDSSDTSSMLDTLGFTAFTKTLVDDASAFEATGTLKSGYVVATKAEAKALTPVDGRKIFITSSDGGEFTMKTGAAAGTYNDDGGSYCGTKFTSGDGSSGFLRNYDDALYPHWYGALDDDTTDALAAFDNMVASLVVAGVGKIRVPDKGGSAYYLSAAIELPSNITIDIDPTVKFRTDTAVGWSPATYPDPQFKNACFIFNGSLNQSVTTTLTTLTAVDDTTAIVADATGFAVGDDVWIADDNLSDGGFHYQREWNRIIGISGTAPATITWEMPLNFAYAATDTSIYKIVPCENSHIIGGVFDQAADTTNETHGIGGQFAKGCSVRASKGQNLRGKLVAVWSSYDFNTHGPEVIDAQVTTPGLGYGVQYLLCRHSNIFGGIYSNLRHATDFSGGSDLLVTGAHAVWLGQSAGTAAYSMGHGLRTRRAKLKDSFAVNWARGVLSGNPTFAGDYDIDVRDNEFVNCEIGVYYVDGVSGGQISGNRITNCLTIGIGLQGTSDIDILENDLDITTDGTRGNINVFASSNSRVINNKIQNSSLRAINAAGNTGLIINGNEIKDSTQEDIYIITHLGELNINGNNIECSAGAYESIEVLGATGAGQIPRMDAKHNSIIGNTGRTVGIRASYVAQAVIKDNTIEDVAEGVRCDYGDSPMIVGNRIDNVTNGIRLTDDATDVMTTYYSASNVVTAFTTQLVNSGGAAAGTFV